MEFISKFCYIFKCRLVGWCILRFLGGGFVGSPELLKTFDLAVHMVDLVEKSS